MITEGSFKRTVAALQRAALDDAHWLSAATLVNEACGAKGHSVGYGEGHWHSASDGQLFFLRFCFAGQRREDWERRYLRDYAHRDERLRRMARLPDGAVVHTDELFAEGERKTSAVYNELMREMRAQDGLNVRLAVTARSHLGWNFADSSRDGGWSSDQVRMIERLRPHMRQYISVRQAMVDACGLGASLSRLLDNTRACVIQLDRCGKIVAANDQARDRLRRREGLFAPGGFLRATAMEKNVELQRLLASAIRPFGQWGTGGSMVIGDASRSNSCIVHVHPVAAEQTDARTRRVAALVLAVSAASPVGIDPDLVALALGLTGAESRLAGALAAGHSTRDIATATGRKRGTVHWHLNQIFRKLNITRQVQLVRLVLSLQPLNERRHSEQDRSPERE